MTNNSNNHDEIRANIEKQLLELEILQSIYANSNELVIEDESAVDLARLFLDDKAKPGELVNIGFVIRFTADAIDEAVKPLQEYIQVKKMMIKYTMIPR